MTRKNILIAVGVVLVGAAVVGANLWFKRDTGAHGHDRSHQDARPRGDRVGVRQDSAEALVNISADTPGRVVESRRQRRRPRQEGPVPAADRSASRCGRASTAARRRCRRPRRRSISCGSRSRPRACSSSRRSRHLKRQQDLWTQQLTTRETLDKAENDVKTRQSALQEREQQVDAQAARIKQERAGLESARYDLSKVRIESPIDGIVTRRNIQEGETAVIGTMNNAGTVLLTVADMSVIQAEVEVDETNIPNVADRPDGEDHDRRDSRQDVQGPRHRDRQQPDSDDAARHAAGTQATNFKVVVVARRADARRAARLHVHGRHHDGDAQRTSRPCRFRRSPCASWSTTRTARS